MVSEYNIRLNPNCAAAVNTGLKFKSGDKGIIFRIAVEELDTTGTTAKIVFWRANGTSVESDITGTNGIYSYKTLGNEFAVPGKTIADVKVYSGDDRVSTASFIFEVGVDTMDGLGAGTGGYSDRLEQLVSEAEEAGAMTEQAKVDLQSATANLNATEKDMEATVQNFKDAYGEVGALNPRGNWSSSTEYQIRDVVYHNSFSWICLVQNTGKEPSTANAAYWQQMTDLQSIISGTTTVGNASKLGGNEPSYFATAKSVSDIVSGTTTVGNAASLGGETSEAWQTKLDNIQTTSRGTLSQAGWYRVAEYKSSSESTLIGSLSNTVDLFIKRTYNNVNNEYHHLKLRSTFNNQLIISIDSKSNNQLFTKARYSYNATELIGYLEVYYSSNTGNSVIVELSHVNDYERTWQAITPTLTSETVDGVTVTTTYDIPANASPVTDLDLANYLPLSGGTLTGELFSKDIQVKDNAYIDSYASDSVGTATFDALFGKTRARLQFDKGSEHNFKIGIYTNNGSEWSAYKEILHTGNSAKVAIQSSAPSDTSALWVDTANKVIKAYIDGAWTQVS